MDIRQLTFFITIAELGSLSSAAQKLNISQPTLSLHLAELEKRLDVQLMIRGPRGMSLTHEGEIFLNHAKWMRERLHQGFEQIKARQEAPTGAVRLGLPPSVGMVLAVPLAETVRLEMPDLRLRMVEAMSGFLKDWLVDGALDLAFLYDLDSVSHLPAQHLLNEPLYFVSAPDNWPFATDPDQPVALAELARVELTLPGAPHGLRRLIERAAAEAGVVLNVTIEMDALSHIKELVARGSAHTVLSSAASHDLVAAGRLVQAPILPEIARPLYIVQGHRGAAPLLGLLQPMITEMIARGFWPGTTMRQGATGRADVPPIRRATPAQR